MIASGAAAAVAWALAQVFPASLDPATLSAWLAQAGVAPAQVVAVSPSAATAVVERSAAPDGRIALRLRALALTPDAARRSAVTAWEMPLEVDCRAGQVRLGATTGYPVRTSPADGVTLAPAEAAWRKPQPRTALESAWRSACDAGFRAPLAAAPTRVAQAPTAPPAPPVQAAPPVRRQGAASAPDAARDAVARAPAPSRRGGRNAVQVVSSPAEADTRQALARLQRRFGELETRIEPAQVRGRTVYRGVVAGFGSRADALAFCRTLQQSGHDCLAR